MVDARFPELWPWGGKPPETGSGPVESELFRRMDEVMRDLRPMV